MKFNKSNNSPLISLSTMDENATFDKQPEIAGIFARIQKGRESFKNVQSNILRAVMEISKLALAMVEYPRDMERIAHHISDATSLITEEVTDTVNIAGEVLSQQEEFTATIETCSSDSTEVVKRIADGQAQLTEVRDLSINTTKLSKEMQTDMGELSDVIKNINTVIDGINDISGQTNLLALNASIEAARAGEAGKGFAVVADEIRNLAEETKQLTATMAEFLEGIEKASRKSTVSAEETLNALNVMTEKIGQVWEINETNQHDLHRVNDSISGLSSVSEEIASSMSELSEKSSNIKEACHDLEDEIDGLKNVSNKLQKTTEPIDSIEKDMDDAAKVLGNMATDPFFDIGKEQYAKYVTNAIAAHQGWLATLKEMVESKTIIPLQADAHKCGFGHFYYSVNPSEELGFLHIWKPLDEKHRTFHGFGSKAINALISKDYDQAMNIYKEAEAYSKGLLSDLNAIKQILEK